jgi:hypothetical protein
VESQGERRGRDGIQRIALRACEHETLLIEASPPECPRCARFDLHVGHSLQQRTQRGVVGRDNENIHRRSATRRCEREQYRNDNYGSNQ